MKIRTPILFLVLPLLIAAKTDPLSDVPETDRAILSESLKRFAKDQMKLDFQDLYEIQEQDVAMKRELGLADNAPRVNREAFAERMKEAVAGGGTPVLQSFELTDAKASSGHYLIRACSKAQRENFHYKGIIQFDAFVRDEKVTFGSWSFVVYSPHSCSQTEDSPV